MDVVWWIKDLLTEISLSQAEAMESLDRRFREVPLFIGVRHFSNFSTITQ